MRIKSVAEARSKYGSIVNGVWAEEAKWLFNLEIPEEVAVQWINTFSGKPTRKIYCNLDLHAPLLAALKNVVDRGLLKELKTFDGCFCIRQVRGCRTESSHSWGLSIDLNASCNQLGCTSTLSPAFVQCFKDAGMFWGGEWLRSDPMHFGIAEF